MWQARLTKPSKKWFFDYNKIERPKFSVFDKDKTQKPHEPLAYASSNSPLSSKATRY